MNKSTLANPNHTLGVTTPALTGRCCGSPVFVPPTPAALHGVSTLRLSSTYLQYDSNRTFRNVPLLLSHACLCAGWFDAYHCLTLQKEIQRLEQEADALVIENICHCFYLTCPDTQPRHQCWDIAYTTSRNLIHWTKHGVVIPKGQASEWNCSCLLTGRPTR